MTNPYRAMCAELVEAMTDDSTDCWQREADVIDRARALLAQPQPVAQPPADGEVTELVEWLQSMRDLAGEYNPDEQRRYTRAAELLERPTPQPVAVSERLPEPEDCDEQGRCWLLTVEDEYPQWRLHSIEGAQPGGAMIWVPVDSSPGVMVDCFYTSHWLPANALPTPETNV